MSQDDYDQGKKYFGAKDYKKAIECFQKCYIKKFNQVRSLLYMSDCNLGLKELSKLKECIDKILELDKNNTQLYFYVGKYEFELKHYDEAYKNFQLFVEKNRLSDSQNIAVYECLYECKMKQGICDVALGHISYAEYFESRDRSKKIELAILKVKAMNKLGKHNEVLEQLKRHSIENEKNEIKQDYFLEKAIALSSCELDDNNKGSREECINICLDNYDKNKKFLYPMALCFFNQGEFSSGMDPIQEYIKNEPYLSEGHFLQGKLYIKLQDFSNANQSFSKAISVNPRAYNAYLEIANILVQQKKYSEALNQIKNINPTQEETNVALLFLLKKAEINYNLKNTKDANIIMDQVGELLRVNDIENKITPSILSEALEQYFKLFYLKGGYDISDFNKGTEELGTGGFGIVTKGKLKNIDVAVKQYKIDPKKRKERGMTTFFINCINEMKNHEELKGHPNILKLLTMFYVNDLIYIVTELCSGFDLHKLLHDTSIEFPFKRRIEILIQVAEGLKYMHSFARPYIHHDIKSLNILLINKYDKNNLNKIKICDFGLTKNTWVFNAAGTPAFIAPELILCRSHSAKVDVYAFGIMMWEMFTRTSPFKGIEPRELGARIINRLRPDTDKYESMTTSAIKALIEKCWENEETARPTIEEVYNKLKQMI